jgi:uncharacterized membrane protein (UPF0127 family)
MFRKSLGDNSGMVFKFSNPQVLNFWGLNTYIPLDIAFVSQDNKIMKIKKIAPLSLKTVSSEVPCAMAIEANDSYFENNRIKEGDTIEIAKDDLGFDLVNFIKK